jgi:hypothetical protein
LYGLKKLQNFRDFAAFLFVWKNDPSFFLLFNAQAMPLNP